MSGEAPRIVLMPGNNALIDARVMKNLRSAAELGYDAIALGISRGDAVREEVFDWGGRVVVQPITVRYEAWRRYRRTRVFFDRTDRSIARAYAAHLRFDANFDQLRRERDRAREAAVAQPKRAGRRTAAARQLKYFAIRVMVKARSLPADREIRRDAMDPVLLERWRQRRFRLLRLTPWRARWRRALPEAVDRAMDLGPRLEELAPDIVHVHDVYMMHVAAAYAAKAAKAGRRVALVYDAREFVPGLAHVPPKQVEAYSRLEAEFIQDFDRVVTVSEGLAELLVGRHGLTRRPAVVMNGPMVDRSAQPPSLREVVGVGEGTPLLVYSGVVNPARGIGSVVRALALVEGVHLALVVNNRGTAVTHLLAEAERLGLADRLHLAPYVPHDQVARYVASADAGVSPLSRAVNHDIALTNKFCEYVVAGLPVVTSDTPEQARLVEDLDLGAVFKADDVADCARAIKDVLDRRRELATRIGADQELRHRFTWAAQVETLARVYREVAN